MAKNWTEVAGDNEATLERLAHASETLAEKRPLKVKVDGKFHNIVDCDTEMAALMQRIGLYAHNYNAKNPTGMQED